MALYCCPECFDDRGLRKHIIPTKSNKKGRCGFCESIDVDLVDPRELADVFETLISVYDPDPAGKPLVQWMKEDWQLFTHPRMDAAHAKELLSEILDNGDIVRQTFAPSAAYKSEALAQWETLRDELMYTNRYFLDKALDTARLKGLLELLLVDDMPTQWYRARILSGDTPYDIKDMGAPPKRLATHGRANPPGIPYLYLGSIPETAAAEVRPHTGEVACVAEFTIATPLEKAVDLRNPRKLVSPFGFEDPSVIGLLRADIGFLERLGEELTRPILPRGAAIDYIPSQYLCEFIRKEGFDGVVYSSSVSKGFNLALFDPAKAVGKEVVLYNIKSVSVDITLA